MKSRKRKIMATPEHHNKRRYQTRYMTRQLQAVQQIEKWWLQCKCSYASWCYSNDTDFIMLEAFRIRDRVFRLVDKDNHVYRFHPSHLVEWFLKEGKFINPYTRVALNIIEIKRLDQIMRVLDPNHKPLADIYEQIEQKRKLEYERNQTCLLLFNESMDCIHSILRIMLGPTEPYARDMQMLNVFLPHYFHIMQQIFQINRQFAHMAIVFVHKLLYRITETDFFRRQEKLEDRVIFSMIIMDIFSPWAKELISDVIMRNADSIEEGLFELYNISFSENHFHIPFQSSENFDNAIENTIQDAIQRYNEAL